MERKLIEDARAELNVAIRQSIPSDDQIIMERVRKAHDQLERALLGQESPFHGPRCGCTNCT